MSSGDRVGHVLGLCCLWRKAIEVERWEEGRVELGLGWMEEILSEGVVNESGVGNVGVRLKVHLSEIIKFIISSKDLNNLYFSFG